MSKFYPMNINVFDNKQGFMVVVPKRATRPAYLCDAKTDRNAIVAMKSIREVIGYDLVRMTFCDMGNIAKNYQYAIDYGFANANSEKQTKEDALALQALMKQLLDYVPSISKTKLTVLDRFRKIRKQLVANEDYFKMRYAKMTNGVWTEEGMENILANPNVSPRVRDGEAALRSYKKSCDVLHAIIDMFNDLTKATVPACVGKQGEVNKALWREYFAVVDENYTHKCHIHDYAVGMHMYKDDPNRNHHYNICKGYETFMKLYNNTRNQVIDQFKQLSNDLDIIVDAVEYSSKQLSVVRFNGIKDHESAEYLGALGSQLYNTYYEDNPSATCGACVCNTTISYVPTYLELEAQAEAMWFHYMGLDNEFKRTVTKQVLVKENGLEYTELREFPVDVVRNLSSIEDVDPETGIILNVDALESHDYLIDVITKRLQDSEDAQ